MSSTATPAVGGPCRPIDRRARVACLVGRPYVTPGEALRVSSASSSSLHTTAVCNDIDPHKNVLMNACGAVPNKRSASLICGGSTTLKNAVEMMLPEQDRRSQQRSIHSFSCPYSQTSWYRNSANFACREFSEVLTRKVASRPPLGALFLLAILAFLSKAHRQQEFVPTSTRPRPSPTRAVVCRQPHRHVLVLP